MAEDQQNQDGETAQSVLRRKATAGREDHQSRAMSMQKALRLTLAKVADNLHGMAMAVIGARVEDRDGDNLTDLFDPADLLLLLDGPAGARGAAVLDAAFVGGLIQQQTMGKVQPIPENQDPRPMTPTDAAICAPFMDALLSRVATLPDTAEVTDRFVRPRQRNYAGLETGVIRPAAALGGGAG